MILQTLTLLKTLLSRILTKLSTLNAQTNNKLLNINKSREHFHKFMKKAYLQEQLKAKTHILKYPRLYST